MRMHEFDVQSTVNGLKGQVRQLEAEYERIVHAKAPPSRQVAPANSDGDNALLDAYARLTIQKEELRKENDVLQSVALAHAKFQRQMEIAMEAEKVLLLFLYVLRITS